MVDVPVHITNPPAVERHVQIIGGTNWDLSRTAVQTPIRQLEDPVPVRMENDGGWMVLSSMEDGPVYKRHDNVPKTKPHIAGFHRKKASLTKNHIKLLEAQSDKAAYVVVGHADANEPNPLSLSWQRANAVAKALRSTGHKVADVKAFGSARPAAPVGDDANLRVEVYPISK